MTSLAARLLGALLVAAALFGGGARMGYVAADNACKARQDEAKVLATEMHNAAAIAGSRSEKATAKRITATEAVFTGIQQGAILYAQNHPASTDCRLDDDGLRLWIAANAGADTAAATEPDAAVSAADDASERGNDRSADQSPDDGAGLSPVPRPAAGIGGLVELNGDKP